MTTQTKRTYKHSKKPSSRLYSIKVNGVVVLETPNRALAIAQLKQIENLQAQLNNE